MDIRPFLSVIKDELAHLAVHGARVYDAHKTEHFTCIARLVAVLSDYRGIEKFVGGQNFGAALERSV